jgi:hypothetical protein
VVGLVPPARLQLALPDPQRLRDGEIEVPLAIRPVGFLRMNRRNPIQGGVMVKSLLAAVAAALVFAGLAFSSSQRDTFTLTANLKARSEVPKPARVPVGASGLFRGKAVELANDKASLTWRLTFSHLSGKAMQAHIHLGKPGKAGNVLVALCAPCKSGQTGKAVITHAQLKSIEAGVTYANVHTRKNAAGEIRGQIKASG